MPEPSIQCLAFIAEEQHPSGLVVKRLCETGYQSPKQVKHLAEIRKREVWIPIKTSELDTDKRDFVYAYILRGETLHNPGTWAFGCYPKIGRTDLFHKYHIFGEHSLAGVIDVYEKELECHQNKNPEGHGDTNRMIWLKQVIAEGYRIGDVLGEHMVH